MKTTDSGKIIEIIDNRNYEGEAAWIFKTYYYVGYNPFLAVFSLLKNFKKEI